jgi:hypothetical protein
LPVLAVTLIFQARAGLPVGVGVECIHPAHRGQGARVAEELRVPLVHLHPHGVRRAKPILAGVAAQGFIAEPPYMAVAAQAGVAL